MLSWNCGTSRTAFSRGRVSVHCVAGGTDADQRREGDYLTKDERTDECLDVLKAAWTGEQPVSYDGRHYRFEDFTSDVKPW